MSLYKKIKIFFLSHLSYLIIVIIIFSCASNKTVLTENHPEIEKLWIEYFDNLNKNKFDEAVSYLDNEYYRYGKT